MSSLHLGVYLGTDGGAALFNGQTLELVFEERSLSRSDITTRYIGPGKDQSSSVPYIWCAGTAQLPRESIRACLRGRNLTWSELHSVTIIGPEGSLERFKSEYSQHQGFSHELNLYVTSAQTALNQLALYELGLREAVSLVMSSERTLKGLSAYALFQTRGVSIQELYHLPCSESLCTLQSPVLVYLALIERARAQLGIRSTDDHHPLEWASVLASSNQTTLTQLKRWFSTTVTRFEIEVSSYDMWLEILCIERRLRSEKAKMSTPKSHLRGLWAALIAKAQQELGAALRMLMLHAQREAAGLPLLFTGDLALDPTLIRLMKHDVPELQIHHSSFTSDAGIAIGAAIFGSMHTTGHLPVSKYGLLHANMNEGELLIQQNLQQLRAPLSAHRSEAIELGKRFARKLLKGGLIGYFEGPNPIGYGPQVSRVCFVDPCSARAPHLLNMALEKDFDSPTYLICPSHQVSQFFEEITEPLPYSSILCKPKDSYREVLSASTRLDGNLLVLPIHPQRSPILCELCEALSLHFNRLPILLAGSLIHSSGHLVTYPSDALHTLSSGVVDALILGTTWVESALSQQKAKGHLLPPPHMNSLDSLLLDLMRDFLGELDTLDQLIFDPDRLSVDWSPQMVQRLSRELAPYRESSKLYEYHPLLGSTSELTKHRRKSDRLTFLLNPHGMTKVIDEQKRWPARLYSWPQAATLLSLTREQRLQEARLSQLLHLPPRDQAALIRWGIAELEGLGVSSHPSWRPQSHVQYIPSQLQGEVLLAPFQDAKVNLREELRALWSCLKGHGYNEELLASFRGDALPRVLTHQPVDLLLRLFWRGEALSRVQLMSLLGEQVMTTLIELGVLIGKDDLKSQIKLDCVSGAIIASDQVQPLSRVGMERLIPALTAHERGFVRLGLSKRNGRTLDLSETLGGVAITQARISRPIDLLVRTARAYRFTLFNLQLNGVEPNSIQLSTDLRSSTAHLYDQIYARSHEILREASAFLKPKGRIITLTEDLASTARAPVSILHRALGLPLCSELISLDDPRLYQGFDGYTGYWIIEHRDELDLDPITRGVGYYPQTLYRPLQSFPCHHLHEYLDHYFMPPLKAQELTYPHPCLNLIKESRIGDQKSFSVSNERWPSLAALQILDDVYAHLKSLMVQRQASPVTVMSSELVRLGLKIVKRRQITPS